MSESRVRTPDRMRQIIDFGGLEVDGYIYPTDIDGLIEYKNTGYILFEVKRRGTPVPYGQRLALQRMADDFARCGKRAVAIVCEHAVRDTDRPVTAARCKVREMYTGGDGKWTTMHEAISVRDAVDDIFKAQCTLTRGAERRQDEGNNHFGACRKRQGHSGKCPEKCS